MVLVWKWFTFTSNIHRERIPGQVSIIQIELETIHLIYFQIFFLNEKKDEDYIFIQPTQQASAKRKKTM